jgi:DNA-binding LytR/AlgR family response regulator
MKPVRPERLAEAVRRVVSATAAAELGEVDDETIPVELAGVIRFVSRSQVRFVEAHGDYARLHTSTGSHLVRTSLSTLEQRWAAAGFVRIHRSTLVSLAHVDEVRVADGRCSVLLAGHELPVSRRHTRELRDRLAWGGSAETVAQR